jgi:hypothetical protein
MGGIKLFPPKYRGAAMEKITIKAISILIFFKLSLLSKFN